MIGRLKLDRRKGICMMIMILECDIIRGCILSIKYITSEVYHERIISREEIVICKVSGKLSSYQGLDTTQGNKRKLIKFFEMNCCFFQIYRTYILSTKLLNPLCKKKKKKKKKNYIISAIILKTIM